MELAEPAYFPDINPMNLNLARRLSEDEDFKESLQAAVERLAFRESCAKDVIERKKARSEFNQEIWKLSGRNASLLMPWFFPKYPGREPFDLRNRPFNMILMFMFAYATVVFRGSRQMGKEQPYSAGVLTPNGWRTMGSLKVGDEVFGRDGKPCVIRAIHEQGVVDVYELTFTDGSKTACGWEHNWLIKRAGCKNWKVETLAAIVGRSGYAPSSDLAIRIPLAQPVEFPEQSHELSPYTIGALLGNGGMTQQGVRFTSSDPETMRRMEKDSSLTFSPVINKGVASPYDFYLRGVKEGRTSSLQTTLRRLGMFGKGSLHKSIPESYLRDSVRNRWELLRGLMDTDGSIYGNCSVEYYSSSPDLIRDVAELVEGLGGSARVRKKGAWFRDAEGNRKQGSQAWRIRITRLPQNPFHLRRKADRFYTIKYEPTRVLKTVVKLEPEISRCLEVDSVDHTYLTDHCIVTHNTTTLGTDMRLTAELFSNFKQLYIAPHTNPLETFSRKFVEIEKAFRYPVTSSKFKQNMTFKAYPNGSEIDMQRVMTSATPVRGKSCSKIVFDETVGHATVILILEGSQIKEIKIADMLAGMTTIDFDENENIQTDKVSTVICKGERHTWRVRSAGGDFVECTGSTRIYTRQGWHALCEFISWEEAARCEKTLCAKTTLAQAAAVDPGFESWRRVHGFFAAAFEIVEAHGREILYEPRGGAGEVLQGKVAPAEQLYQHGRPDSSEPGLRRGELCVLNATDTRVELHAGAGVYLRPISPRKILKARLPSLGRRAYLGSGGLVVHGRRLQKRAGVQHRHPLLLSQGGGKVVRVAHEERLPRPSAQDEEAGQILLDTANPHGVSEVLQKQDPALHAPVHALQAGHRGNAGVRLQLLRGLFYARGRVFQGQQEKPLLLEEIVPRGKTKRKPRQKHRELWRHEGSLPAHQETYCQVSTEKTSATGPEQRAAGGEVFGSRVSGEMGRVEERVSQATESRGATGKAGDGAGLPALCPAFPQHRDAQDLQGRAARLLHGSPMPGEAPGQDDAHTSRPRSGEAEVGASFQGVELLTLDGWDTIAAVEYAGVQEVWDIETEKHHTFFAGGIGVHNCQLFDPGLEMEVMEVMSDSKIKSCVMAGTSTTTETLLETRYQEGCQAVWHIHHPNGKKIINCGDPEDVIPYIGPYKMEDPVTKDFINPLNGFYQFMNPDGFRDRIVSIHVPQILNPDKINNPLEWNGIHKALIRDRRTAIKEKLGIPLEEGNREVTLADLKAICVLPDGPEERQRKCKSGYYRSIVSAFDWGGADYNTNMKTKVSTTCHVILGISPDDKVHILHGRRHGGASYPQILNAIVLDHVRYNAGALASDFGGGTTYHHLLRTHPQIDPTRHIIFDYDDPESPLCQSPSKSELVNMLMLNKTDSLTHTFMSVVAAEPYLLCPSWDEFGDLLVDFVNNHRVMSEKSDKGRRFTYHRHGSKPDDFLHAVNFGLSLLRLHYNQATVVDIAARNMIRNAMNSSGSVSNGFAAALSSYSRGGDDGEFD